MSVLEKGMRASAGVVSTFQASASTERVSQANSFLSDSLSAGAKVLDHIANKQNSQLKKDYNEAEKEFYRMESINKDISSTRMKDMIDNQYSNWKTSLTGEDYLNEGALHAKRKEWSNGIFSSISGDEILDVEQKEKLKAYVNGLNDNMKMHITTNSYTARKEKHELDTLNNIEDRRIAIGKAILEGNIDDVSKFMASNDADYDVLARLNEKKYNKEWRNKEKSDNVVFAGMSVINKAFKVESDKFLLNPTDEGFKSFEEALDNVANSFTNPEMLVGILGSDHGLEYGKFLEQVDVLKNKAKAKARNSGELQVKKEKKEKEMEVFKIVKDATSEYASSIGAQGDLDPVEFSNEGAMFSTTYSKLNEDYLEKKAIVISDNQELFDFLENNPEAPKYAGTILSDSKVTEIERLYKEGNHTEITSLLNTLFGGARPSFVDNKINEELVEKTNGAVNLKGLDALSGYVDDDNATLEEKNNYREAIKTSDRTRNDPLLSDFAKRNINNSELLGKTSTGLFGFKEKNKVALELSDLARLSSTDSKLSKVAKSLSNQITSGAISIATADMGAKEREEFSQLNDTEKVEKINSLISGDKDKQKELQKHINDSYDFYLGKGNRPVTFKGKTAVLNEQVTDKMIGAQIDRVYDSGNSLYFDDKELTKGQILSETTGKLNFEADGESAKVFWGDKPVKNKDGSDFVINPAKGDLNAIKTQEKTIQTIDKEVDTQIKVETQKLAEILMESNIESVVADESVVIENPVEPVSVSEEATVVDSEKTIRANMSIPNHMFNNFVEKAKIIEESQRKINKLRVDGAKRKEEIMEAKFEKMAIPLEFLDKELVGEERVYQDAIEETVVSMGYVPNELSSDFNNVIAEPSLEIAGEKEYKAPSVVYEDQKGDKVDTGFEAKDGLNKSDSIGVGKVKIKEIDSVKNFLSKTVEDKEALKVLSDMEIPDLKPLQYGVDDDGTAFAKIGEELKREAEIITKDKKKIQMPSTAFTNGKGKVYKKVLEKKKYETKERDITANIPDKEKEQSLEGFTEKFNKAYELFNDTSVATPKIVATPQTEPLIKSVMEDEIDILVGEGFELDNKAINRQIADSLIKASSIIGIEASTVIDAFKMSSSKKLESLKNNLGKKVTEEDLRGITTETIEIIQRLKAKREAEALKKALESSFEFKAKKYNEYKKDL